MTKISTRFKIANDLFDIWDFAGAIRLYEEALFLDEESQQDGWTKEDIFINLIQARDLARLVFLRKFVEKYPDSILAQRQLIHLYLAEHRPKEAYTLCEKLFEQMAQQAASQEHVVTGHYSLRFGVGLSIGNPTHLAKDFLTIWKTLHNPRGKRRLLTDILSSEDARLLPAFIELSQHPDLSPNIQVLFKQKAESLQLLQQVFDTELADT